MSKILIIAEHTNDTANASTAKCVQCATEIPNAEIDVAVFSDNGESVANEIAKMDGVTKVIRIEHDANSNPMAALIAPQVIGISKGYTHIFGPSTTFGKDLMPRVAALMDVNQISDVMEILDSHKFKQPIYAGNAIVTVEAPTTAPANLPKKPLLEVRCAMFRAVRSADLSSHLILVHSSCFKDSRATGTRCLLRCRSGFFGIYHRPHCRHLPQD